MRFEFIDAHRTVFRLDVMFLSKTAPVWGLLAAGCST